MPTRAARPCPEPGCPELTTGGRCPRHARPAWRNSTRDQRLPDDWPDRRLRILNRDGHTCQVRFSVCAGLATEVDHIIPGDDHSDANLQAICTPCHRLKSSSEGGRAAYARRMHIHA
ncbi:MAG: HNH endonuclease [Acidimicrobiales bacterium]